MSGFAADAGLDLIASGSASASQPWALTPAQRAWIGFTAMLFGNFMAILDVQIVASSVNEIRAGLSAGPDEISWVQTSYLIAEVIGIPLAGYLARAFSTRVYFSACALGFTAASLACALSWNLASMLTFRAIQGFLAGGLIPTTMSALFLIFPEGRRSLPYVLIGMVSLLAPSVGAAAGGYITTTLSWPWLFLINLLPGLIVGALVWRFVDIDRPQTGLLKRFDVLGLAGLVAFLCSLQFVLEEGPRYNWWEDDTIRGFALLAACGAVIFAWRSVVASEPIVNLRCLSNRNFAVGCAVSFVVGVMLYGVVFIIPTFLGLVRGYDSLQIGRVTMLSGITMFLSAPLAGRLQERIDPRLMMAYGLGMVALGTWLNARLTSQADLGTFLVPQLIRGHGFTFCLVPMMAIALGTLPEAQVQSGSGLFNLMRNLGGAFGIASIQTSLRHLRALHEQHLTSAIDLARVPVADALTAASQQWPAVATHDPLRIAASLLLGGIRREAAVRAYNDTLLLLAALVVASILLLSFAHKPVRVLVPHGD